MPASNCRHQGNFDAVDYFLFIQKGYCDYFGTVMAVMLRSVGVPARLATGYLPGTYDYGKQRYEVNENDGHAWTEVYFPPYGWIEFEPTPAEPAIVRPEGSLFSTEPYVPATATIQTTRGGIMSFLSNIRINVNVLRFVPVLLALLLVGGLLWALWPLMERRLATSNFIVTIYGRMCRYAGWAGLTKPLAQTPYEYARQLGDAVSQAPAGTSRWSRPASAPASTEAQHIAAISNAYVQTRYSQHPPTAETRESVVRSWQAVKGRLWRLVARGTMDRMFRRKKAPAPQR